MSTSEIDRPPAPGDRPPPEPRAPLWPQLRPFVLRLHFYAGILVGPFLLIAAVTGLLYTVTPQLSDYVHRDELTVDQVGERALPLGEQVAAARAAHPEGTITEVRPPIDAEGTTRVVLAVDDVPTDYGRTVFVDPYTAQVRGELTTFGEWLPVRAWIDELHRNLHLGDLGRNYSELAASWLWVVALGGLVLWISRVRQRSGSAAKATKAALVPETNRKGRTRALSWHGTVGVWIIAALLLLSITGLTWSRHAGETIGDVRTALSWTTPSVETDPTGSGTGGGGHHGEAAAPVTDSVIDEGVGIDGVDAAARAAGLQTPMEIIPPAGDGQAWKVQEAKRDWPTRYDSVAVDADSGQVTDKVEFANWPFMAKMTNWTIDAHMGILFGLVNQILLALTAIGLIAVIIRGYQMWWLRRPTRARGLTFGPPAKRGALRRMPPWAAVTAVVIAVLLGWYMPLFGITLAVFVAVDVALGVRHHRRSRGTALETASLPARERNGTIPGDQLREGHISMVDSTEGRDKA
ncbi:PepSY-associated TM helix domain-containing protein [Rhodococcus sp. NPDC058521]|uniref:PepSY-associated TM helix domain-containing protein n=1 Tax=Rhodococcus sp. NPDC058521 TaxID=3346536 RepID=UPI00366782E5